MGKLEGKIAIVTGSTEGIGQAAARKFASEGAAGVLIVGRNEKRAIEVAESITRDGGKAYPCRADISIAADAENMVRTAIEQWGRLDILINNAANTSTAGDVPIADADPAEWQKAFDVNATGTMYCCKYAVPAMIESGGGSIVNASSGLGEIADERFPGYACSKAALVRLSQHIAIAYGSKGIRSNTLVIGLIETQALDYMPPEMLKIMAENHLLGRLGKAEEIANVMAFLASDEASFVTGATMVADGGFLSHLPHLAQMRNLAASAMPA